VFTPASTGRELVFIASNQNVIRTIDGINGTLVNSRTIQPPFLQSDIGCGDIPNYIGITGTPIIDPTTETVYFFSKGYKGGASGGGVLAGQYAFYAVDFNTLQDKPGFPVIIDGNYADNDPTRYFLGGTVLQRPSLTSLNGVVIGAFGGHCDLFNYTGMLVAVSKTPGVGVTSIYAMESSPGAPTPQPLDYKVENGGKAGIWQSGMGLATDISRIFLATGNGQGHQNGAVPSSGRVPLSTLDETVANFQVSASGTLSLTDYFEPFEYVNMDAADRDLGSGGVVLLDPTVFAAPNVGISRIALSVGKNGKCYILDANSLGGFRQGPQGTDGILQTITAANAVFGGSGSYPLEGGYI
jgi:iron transport multicopper oxidase